MKTSIAIVVLAGAAAFAAADPRDNVQTFLNESGVLRTLNAATSSAGNPFFQDLGTNGRRCVTCHQPAQAWTITPVEVRDRFERTSGLDPIFRANDGANCEGADVSSPAVRRRAFSLLLTRGVIRIGLDAPPNAEFAIVGVDDPYRCGSTTNRAISVYRRPLPATNLQFVSALMWDGRESVAGRAIRDGLITQTRNAVIGHAQGDAPSAATLDAVVDFELGVTAAQALDRRAGSLVTEGARGGLNHLIAQEFCIGINDPLKILPVTPGACAAPSAGLDRNVFTLFGAWANSSSPERQSIARGEAIFNTREFAIDNVSGLNGAPGDPVSGPLAGGTCTVCHNTPNAGNHSIAMALNIGIADASRRTRDLPLFTLRNRTSGALVQTTDPGRAMVTGRWQDVGKFKGPVLRGLAARAPYFHDGSAATLADVVAFYDKRFRVQLSDREKSDLIAFLKAL